MGCKDMNELFTHTHAHIHIYTILFMNNNTPVILSIFGRYAYTDDYFKESGLQGNICEFLTK